MHLLTRLPITNVPITRFSFVAAIALCCACNQSTGPQLAVTTGVVRFHGQPLVGARVIFHPESGRPAQGTTDPEGRFRLATLKPGDGAVVGMHRATITESRSQPEPMPGPGGQMATAPAAAGSLPRNYSDPQTSGLEFEVKAGVKNDFELDLE